MYVSIHHVCFNTPLKKPKKEIKKENKKEKKEKRKKNDTCVFHTPLVVFITRHLWFSTHPLGDI
jgi:hypothetical protein